MARGKWTRDSKGGWRETEGAGRAHVLLEDGEEQEVQVNMGIISEEMDGRDVHLSTPQLNLSRVGHTSPCPPV